VWAQDIEPRRWTPLPVGVKVVGVGYGQTSGDLLFDPLLDVKDAELAADTIMAVYVQSFSLLGKLARFDARLPWQNATWEGLLSGEETFIERRGFADPIFRISVNLSGATGSGAKSQNERSNTIVGAAMSLTVPMGEYFDDKLLNLGSNRYTLRPQLGVVHTRGQWSYELTGSVFLYSDNNDFYNNTRRKQGPLFAIQSHIIRTFKPGLWASISVGYGRGGESAIDGIDKNDKRGILLSALSVGFPVAKKQVMKFSYINSETLENTGADIATFAVGWSLLL